MSTPTPNVWTLNASGLSGDGQKLVGCHIQVNSGNYVFTKPNINDTLATYTPQTPPPTPPPTSFTFPQFSYKDENWIISVNLPLTSGVNATGRWTMLGKKQAFAAPPPVNPQSGEYTAQAGSEVDEDAISANA